MIKYCDSKHYKNQLFVIDNQHTKLIQINYPYSRFCFGLIDVPEQSLSEVNKSLNKKKYYKHLPFNPSK